MDSMSHDIIVTIDESRGVQSRTYRRESRQNRLFPAYSERHSREFSRLGLPPVTGGTFSVFWREWPGVLFAEISRIDNAPAV